MPLFCLTYEAQYAVLFVEVLALGSLYRTRLTQNFGEAQFLTECWLAKQKVRLYF